MAAWSLRRWATRPAYSTPNGSANFTGRAISRDPGRFAAFPPVYKLEKRANLLMGRQVGLLDRGELAKLAAAGEIDTVLAVFPDLYGRLMGKRFDAEHFLARIVEVARTPATICSPSTWRWSRSRATNLPTGKKATATFTSCPTSARCVRQAGSTGRRSCCATCNPNTIALIEPAPRTMLLKQIEAASKLGYDAMAASELGVLLLSQFVSRCGRGRLPKSRAGRLVSRGLSRAARDARGGLQRLLRATSSSPASPSNRPRANGARASTK